MAESTDSTAEEMRALIEAQQVSPRVGALMQPLLQGEVTPEEHRRELLALLAREMGDE